MKKVFVLIFAICAFNLCYSQSDTIAAHEYYAARQRQMPNVWAKGAHTTVFTVADSVMFCDSCLSHIVLSTAGTVFPIHTEIDTSHILLSYLLDSCPLRNANGDCIAVYTPYKRITIDSLKIKH